MLVHLKQTNVDYSYIFVDATWRIFKTLSEVLIAFGVLMLANRYERIRDQATSDALLFTAPLWLLGLYQICLNYALCFTWISLSDLQVIYAIAKARSAFDIAYTAYQFCFALLAMLRICTNGYMNKDLYNDVSILIEQLNFWLLRWFRNKWRQG